MISPSPYYTEFTASNAIASLIGAFWCFSTPDATIQFSESVQHRVLPDGCMDLIFQYERSLDGDINNPQLTIYGSTDRFELFNIKPATEFVGIRFHPGMAGQFLNLSAIDLFQQEVKAQDCASVFGKIFDRLCRCNSLEQALRTLQTSLLELQRMNDDLSSPTREAIRLISSSQGRMPVSQIAEIIGVSERTLRRGVTAAVGLPPKVLARILRFQNTVSHLRSLESSNLCGIALACGYADQAHMAREFQQLAGLTPTTFISR
ncbi:MAG: helix-turn-helix domain-containing protein [Plectolyngbya sp. WJT66-NPBG17]|jgi:AraC-like DNA-binding protein|nr:helix-turn-helix domain-containing protein [Plectolyngbya sp. WJT66-NPBG17]MBW4527930.1 helix-turn-helix domain-containing protein [Phormidium tanganyikae FI6-MK23]